VNILVEGPRWMGQWSEIVVDAFACLGHATLLHYHNDKPPAFRFERFFHGRELSVFSNRRLLAAARGRRIDLLFSIQGKIDAATVRTLRETHPGLKVVYWFGDILLDRARRRVEEVYEHADRLLLSYHGDWLAMRAALGDKADYFPFGVSERFHRLPPPGPGEQRRFSADIAFVGTHYPERDELLGVLARSGADTLRVWGRGWRRSRTIRSRGRLSMTDTLKVHRNAGISLNIHHCETRDGFNMKFFEIPAAGGFQLCDRQPEIERLKLGDLVAVYRDGDDLADKVRYYLDRESLRREMSRRFQAVVFETFRYDIRLGRLLADLGL
jgi:spore maturation protein CgeB